MTLIRETLAECENEVLRDKLALWKPVVQAAINASDHYQDHQLTYVDMRKLKEAIDKLRGARG